MWIFGGPKFEIVAMLAMLAMLAMVKCFESVGVLDAMPEAVHAKLIHPEADAGKKISLHLQR